MGVANMVADRHCPFVAEAVQTAVGPADSRIGDQDLSKWELWMVPSTIHTDLGRAVAAASGMAVVIAAAAVVLAASDKTAAEVVGLMAVAT